MATPISFLQPLSCWKSVIRKNGQDKLLSRSLTTYRNPKPSTLTLPQLSSSQAYKPHTCTKIKTYPPPPTPTALFKTPVLDVQASQIAILDPTSARTNLFSKTNPDGAKVGDILLVRLGTGEPFAGVCINIRRRGVDTGILLRNELTRVPVEMWFKIYSPNVEGVEVVQRALKRARRARLTYMRKPKHDVGSVQGMVWAWQRGKGSVGGGIGVGGGGGGGGETLKGGTRKLKGKGRK